MRRTNWTFQFVYAIALLLWPMVTWAASVTLSSTINDIPASAWVIVLILSAVSGVVSLLQRLKDEIMKPAGETRIYSAWRWFTAAHLIGALFTGLVTFLLAEALNIDDLIESVSIAIMAYAGGRAMDSLADGISAGLVNRIVGVVGGKPPGKEG